MADGNAIGAKRPGVSLRARRLRNSKRSCHVRGAMLFDPLADPLEMKKLANDEKYKSAVAELPVLT